LAICFLLYERDLLLRKLLAYIMQLVNCLSLARYSTEFQEIVLLLLATRFLLFCVAPFLANRTNYTTLYHPG